METSVEELRRVITPELGVSVLAWTFSELEGGETVQEHVRRLLMKGPPSETCVGPGSVVSVWIRWHDVHMLSLLAWMPHPDVSRHISFSNSAGE